MSETTLKPAPKVAAAGVASAGAIVLVAVAKLVGVTLPLELSLALVALAPPVAGYFKKDRRDQPVILPPR